MRPRSPLLRLTSTFPVPPVSRTKGKTAFADVFVKKLANDENDPSVILPQWFNGAIIDFTGGESLALFDALMHPEEG
jgi:hypothetical protein